MFIHLDFMAGVLLKCCSAIYINPLRLGSDRLGHHHQPLLLFTIYHYGNHHVFIHLCVFTRPVSIYLNIISHPPWLLPFLLLASPSSVPFFPCHPTPSRLVSISTLPETAFCFFSASGGMLSMWTFSLSVCPGFWSLMQAA